MINGNLVGFAMFVFAAIVVAVGSLVLKLPDVLVMIAAGAVVAVLDLGLRMFSKGEGGRMMSSRRGGYLVFAPAWIFGTIVVVANVVKFVVTGK